MKMTRVLVAVALALMVAGIGAWSERADAQGQTIKIGVLYDHSGPFSAAGSLNCWRGAKMMIDLINERRNAGAEAIAVDDVRVTARSVAVQGSRALQIDGVEIGRRFTIRAIGSPDALLSALQRPGGIIAQLQQFVSATIDAQQSSTLHVPATRLDLTPQVAKAAPQAAP